MIHVPRPKTQIGQSFMIHVPHPKAQTGQSFMLCVPHPKAQTGQFFMLCVPHPKAQTGQFFMLCVPHPKAQTGQSFTIHVATSQTSLVHVCITILSLSTGGYQVLLHGLSLYSIILAQGPSLSPQKFKSFCTVSLM